MSVPLGLGLGLARAGGAADPGDLLTGLEGYYRFEGNNDDSSGNGRSFSAGGSYVTGKINLGLTGEYLSLGSLETAMFAGADWSVSLWMYAGAAGLAPSVYVSDSLESYTLEVTFQNWDTDLEYLKLLKTGGNSPDDISFTVTKDTWNYVVVAVEGSVLKAYLNGALAWTSTWGTTAGLFSVGTNGASQGPADELACYSIALDQDQVTALYNGGTGLDPTA